MRFSAVMPWVGPAAIAGAALAVVSDQVALVVHRPEMGNDSMGHHAVGSGLYLLAFTLLVGMFGLYARRPDPYGPKVIEYGDARGRYVLVEEPEEEPLIRRGADGPTGRRHRAGWRSGGSGAQPTADTRVSRGV